ncbi:MULTISPECIES: TOMM precursor leader peptide-binding protein [unclassified Brenneria]|uniref:TOMM precursor leader peptide-binding protein n=1 Tax=unclassified Brenneria TaxID=2634434 RepID=UPI00155232EB|nr:TOMM precursor leader peptide-binding protein [Brenneria sp. hezel4-2-4]MEE3650612.1 TOMM precursor leader peptide-binding protein [Brenneria sp. HEZEL_4_2_4]NPD00567.1 TOMM precursor leader peptide-binding protein [Brenneria sp. hezel4-2-4]
MNDKLILLPIQIIETEDAVILKRGLAQLLIPDTNILLIIRVIQKALLQQPYSVAELKSLFAAPVQPLVEELLNKLLEKRFLQLQTDKGPTDQQLSVDPAQEIFYWHFNQYQQQIANTLNQKYWLFVGINKLNMLLLQAMQREGLQNYLIVDDPMLRNIDFFDDNHQLSADFWQQQTDRIVSEDQLFLGKYNAQIGFVVAASEFGSFFLLERWNEYAIKQKLTFYPVLLQNMVGYAGPLVIPHESACLTCLKSRQNSHSNGFAERRTTEQYAFAGQKVAAYHESMLHTLAAVAQFDLVKFISNIQWEVGTLCEIDLLAGSMTRRKLLKAPRCSICSGLHDAPQVNLYQQITSDDAWQEIRQTVGDYEN